MNARVWHVGALVLALLAPSSAAPGQVMVRTINAKAESSAAAALSLKRCALRPVVVQRAEQSGSLTVQVDLTAAAEFPRTSTFTLQPYALRAPGFRIVTTGDDLIEREVVAPPPCAYRGVDATGMEMWATVVDLDTTPQVRGVIAPLAANPVAPQPPLIFVQSITAQVPGTDAAFHAVFAAADGIEEEFSCGLDHCPECSHAPQLASGHGLRGTAGPCKVVELIVDCDYPLHQKNGGPNGLSIAATAQDVETVMLGVNALYRTVPDFTYNLRFAVKQITIRTTAAGDPYNSFPAPPSETEPSGLLNSVGAAWSGVSTPSRDMVHLLTGRELTGATIGLAWVNAVCNSPNAYGISQSRFRNDLATRFVITAHEMGHNLAMGHDSSSGFIMAGLLSIPAQTNFSTASVSQYNAASANYACLSSPSTVPDVLQDEAFTIPGRPILIDVLKNDGQGLICSAPVTTFTLPSGSTAAGGTVTVSTGTGPGGRNQVLYTPSATAGAGGLSTDDSFSYSAAGVTMPVRVTVLASRPAEPPRVVIPALTARYSDMTNGTGSYQFDGVIPNLAAMPQLGAIGTAASINYPLSGGLAAGGPRVNALGAEFTGYIQVPATDVYRFWLVSDDMSRISIGGAQVVINQAVQTSGETTGVVALAAGRHPIKIEYVNLQWTNMLVLSYAPVGGAGTRVTVPASVLWRAPGNCRADVDGLSGQTIDDLFIFVNRWLSGSGQGDFDGLSGTTIDDLFMFINTWLAGC